MNAPSLPPLQLTHFTLSTCVGAGLGAMLDALRAQRSGLTASPFETVTLTCHTGQVSGLDTLDFMGPAAFDCRNNRLALQALREDDFELAVQAARQRYGAARIGVFLGTSTSGILQTEIAYRHRDASSHMTPDFNYPVIEGTAHEELVNEVGRPCWT